MTPPRLKPGVRLLGKMRNRMAEDVATLRTSVSSSSQDQIPLPLAFAGIGLLLAITLPGGTSGGGGFLMGLAVGVLASVLRAFSPIGRPTYVVHRAAILCPHCSKAIALSASTPRPNIDGAQFDASEVEEKDGV